MRTFYIAYNATLPWNIYCMHRHAAHHTFCFCTPQVYTVQYQVDKCIINAVHAPIDARITSFLGVTSLIALSRKQQQHIDMASLDFMLQSHTLHSPRDPDIALLDLVRCGSVLLLHMEVHLLCLSPTWCPESELIAWQTEDLFAFQCGCKISYGKITRNTNIDAHIAPYHHDGSPLHSIHFTEGFTAARTAPI